MENNNYNHLKNKANELINFKSSADKTDKYNLYKLKQIINENLKEKNNENFDFTQEKYKEMLTKRAKNYINRSNDLLENGQNNEEQDLYYHSNLNQSNKNNNDKLNEIEELEKLAKDKALDLGKINIEFKILKYKIYFKKDK